MERGGRFIYFYFVKGRLYSIGLGGYVSLRGCVIFSLGKTIRICCVRWGVFDWKKDWILNEE